jgi:hypothetical protein
MRGLWSTLHDVTAAKLSGLPREVLQRPLAGAEFCVDFRPRGFATLDEQHNHLPRVFDTLHRRLAPWMGRFVGTRVYRETERRGTTGHLVEDRETRLLVRDPPAILLPRKDAGSGGFVNLGTIYFGHRISARWQGCGWGDDPMVQVRLYVKVEDDRKPMPAHAWCVRVEVTLNGPALAAVLDAHVVEDLIGAKLRRLGTEYLSLHRAIPDPGKLRARRGTSKSLIAAINAGVRDHSHRQATRSAREGNYRMMRDGMIRFKPAPGLSRFTRDALTEFSRAAKRRGGKSGGTAK